MVEASLEMFIDSCVLIDIWNYFIPTKQNYNYCSGSNMQTYNIIKEFTSNIINSIENQGCKMLNKQNLVCSCKIQNKMKKHANKGA